MLVRQTARDFAEGEIAPVIARFDEAEEFPAELIRKPGELGVMGALFPTDYGGASLDYVSYALVVEGRPVRLRGRVPSAGSGQRPGAPAPARSFLRPVRAVPNATAAPSGTWRRAASARPMTFCIAVVLGVRPDNRAKDGTGHGRMRGFRS
jgi:Acyl-CoA dehydrogenase, N-terminal domain